MQCLKNIEFVVWAVKLLYILMKLTTWVKPLASHEVSSFPTLTGFPKGISWFFVISSKFKVLIAILLRQIQKHNNCGKELNNLKKIWKKISRPGTLPINDQKINGKIYKNFIKHRACVYRKNSSSRFRVMQFTWKRPHRLGNGKHLVWKSALQTKVTVTAEVLMSFISCCSTTV